MFGWLDLYLKVMYECDQKMEMIVADRFRATQAEVEKLKEQMDCLEPEFREFQRSAFRNENKSKLKESARRMRPGSTAYSPPRMFRVMRSPCSTGSSDRHHATRAEGAAQLVPAVARVDAEGH